MDNRRLARAWAIYDRLVLPHDAPPIQRRECQLAFYAGAACLFRVLLQDMDMSNPDDATEKDEELMAGIADEIAEWVDRFDATLFGEANQ